MANSIFTTSRSLLLAGALAFAALPALAQTAPSTQPPAPAAGSTVAPGAASTAQPVGKSATDQGKTANSTAQPVGKSATDQGKTAVSTAQPVGKSATDQGKSDQAKSTKKVVHKTDKTSKTKAHTVAAKKPAAKPAQPGGTATDPAKMDPAKKS